MGATGKTSVFTGTLLEVNGGGDKTAARWWVPK